MATRTIANATPTRCGVVRPGLLTGLPSSFRDNVSSGIDKV
jgi:hypothetical protein